jgi:hypothetical protein
MLRLTLVCIYLIIISLMLTNIGPAKVDPESIVGIWLFDEGSGDTVKDASGNGHDGEKKGNVKWEKGKFNHALSFPGSRDSYVNIPHADSLSLTTFTITAFLKTETVPADEGSIVTKMPANKPRNYNLRLNGPAGNVCLEFTRGGNWSGNTGKSVVIDGQWHQVAATYDNKSSKVYVDGILDGEKPLTGTPDANEGALTMGADVGGHPFLGIIDEVAIFNAALSENDISSIATKGLEAISSAVSPSGKLTQTWASIKAHLGFH